MRALAKGAIDAVAGNYYTGLYYLYKEGLANKIKVIGEPFLTFSYTFAVKKGNTRLLNLLNRGIEDLQTSGELEKLRYKWFGRNFDRSKFFFYFYHILAGIIGLLLVSWVIAIYLRLKIKKATQELTEINRKLHTTYENTIRSRVCQLTPILANFQNQKWLNNGIFGNGEMKISKKCSGKLFC